MLQSSLLRGSLTALAMWACFSVLHPRVVSAEASSEGPFRMRHLRVAQVNVQTAPAQPPVVAPVAPEPTPRKVVTTNVESHNYMGTIAWSAIAGAVLGAAVGTAIYYIDSGQHARNIAYWAAGGVLVGAGVGVIQVLVQESRVSEAVSSSHAPTDPARTFRLALYRYRF
jgi:hypothetical protein